MRPFVIALFALSLLGAANWLLHRPIAQVPGVLVGMEPVQTEPANRAPIRHGDYELTPLADYAIEARVLSRQDYTFDGGSALAPTDLAVGWKRMSDNDVIAQLELSQSARYFSYRWKVAPPIPADEIVRSAANMHMIPADATAARALAQVRIGEIVTMRGQLVQASRSDGWSWTSSLRRDDSGGGACELMLVDSIERRQR
ncbi:MAG: hypothetical protein ABIQ70_05770 [Dokdonella sp.]